MDFLAHGAVCAAKEKKEGDQDKDIDTA